MKRGNRFTKKERHKAILLTIIQKGRKDGVHTQDLYKRYREHIESGGTLPSGGDEEPYGNRYLLDLVYELVDSGRVVTEVHSRGQGGRGLMAWSTRYVTQNDLEDYDANLQD